MAKVETRVEPGARLLNRELSWLDFNARVLDLVADADVPLLERVKFCSIFSSNLDEFFMVRVAGLTRQVAAGLPVRSLDGLTPREALVAIRDRVLKLTARQSALWEKQLLPSLADAGIVFGTVADCTEEELATIEDLFEREIYPVLTPLAVGPGQPFPYVSGLSLSIGLFVRDPESGEVRFARVKVPEGLPRFVTIHDELLVPLEALIEHFLPWLFPGMEISECALFRVTRDADFDVDDEADDLLEAVEVEVRRRRFGDVVRLEVSDGMSRAMQARLMEGLEVGPDRVFPIKSKLDLADLIQIASFDRPELRDPPWAPVTRPELADAQGQGEVFEVIRDHDVLVQLPYDSFTTSVEAFVRSAARDPHVIAIKSTVYRTSEDSPVVPALIDSAEAGKQSVCLVELKARFDEHRNIEWGRALEQAGVHVVYGYPNLKIHSKITLVVRREGEMLRRYVHIGTGNYHARTARLYEDFGLFTADEEIAADVADLFNHLTGFGRPQRFRKILVAPFNLRNRLIEEIRGATTAAAAGKPARIRLKLNSLTDEAVIDELYAASQAGVEVDVIARCICMLRPGVPGLSDNIRVRSIVGRFLEHSRVYAFEVGDELRVYLGSACLMPRNLDHRIEVVTPVEGPRLQQELVSVLDTLLADNAQAWALDSNGKWERLHPGKGERQRGTHSVLMRRALSRSRRSRGPARRRG